MPKLPRLTGEEFLSFLKFMGFEIIRQRGAHVRLKSADGRVTTIPVHKGKTLPIGLIRKIIREDLDLTYEDFIKLFEDFKK